MFRYATIAVFVLTAALVFGCSGKTPQPKNADAVTTATAAVEPAPAPPSVPTLKLLFFMNPNGRPCRMQKSILDNMHDKLAPLAEVTYVKSTESADRNLFDKYGIRGLPALIVTDRQGAVLTRLPIGIRSEETILAAVRKERAKP